jgi:ferrous iron transport protein A
VKTLLHFFLSALRPNPKCSPFRADSLRDLSDGESARVAGIDLPASMRLRLLELGFLPDAPVRAVRRAPLGDPMQVFIRGSHLSIRAREAGGIRVTKDGR